MFQIHARGRFPGNCYCFLWPAPLSKYIYIYNCIYIYIYIYIYQQKQEEVAVHLHSLQDLLQIFPRNLDRKATCSWLSRISFCEEEVVGLAPWVLMDAPLQYRARALAKHVPRFDSKQHLPLFDQGAGASSGSRFRALRLEIGSN